MKHKSTFIVFVIILVVIYLVGVGVILVNKYRRNRWLWEMALDINAGNAAALQALYDFKKGELRIYEIIEDGNDESSNRYKGPFEIWYKPYSPILGYPHKYSTEVFVDIYNSRMQYMYLHPNKYKFERRNVDINDVNEFMQNERETH